MGGGEYDSAPGFHSGVFTGSHNQSLGQYSVVLGGMYNHAGNYSAVIGGSRLELGDSSVGYSAFTADLSNVPDIGYFGDVDLWIANVHNRARAVRFLTPYSGATPNLARYSAIRAAETQDSDITYILPQHLPDSSGEALSAQTIDHDTVKLGWGLGGASGWLLKGNLGTAPPTNFLGTRDKAPFEIHLHNDTAVATGGNHRVMRYEIGSTSPNIIGGSSANKIDTALSGVAILSGGSTAQPNVIDTFADFSLIVGGSGNHITGHSLTDTIHGWTNGYDVIGGGRNNFMGSDEFRSGFNVIGGGDSNLVGWGSYNNVIGGGAYNLVANAYGTIGGGIGNLLNGSGGLNTIAGGHYNTVGGDISLNSQILCASITGGDSNMIGVKASWSYIGGGYHNLIDEAALYASISGGAVNRIGKVSSWSAIAGGDSNVVGNQSSLSYIGGGDHNLIDSIADHSTIGGGDRNMIDALADHSTIGGGERNRIVQRALHSTIAGGKSNLVDTGSTMAAIGGGDFNRIDTASAYAVVAGGDSNRISTAANYSAIGGGVGNIIAKSSQGSGISSGTSNSIAGSFSTISGGDSNNVQAGRSAIGGGYRNHILPDSDGYSTIAGGYVNIIDTSAGFSGILGGRFNTIKTQGGTVGAGADNLILDSSRYSTIGGGLLNKIDSAEFSTIGGGDLNYIKMTRNCGCPPFHNAGTIAGGSNDTITGLDGRWFPDWPNHYIAPIMGAIGGGYGNTVNGNYSAVPGGFENHAVGLGSTGMGIGNVALDFQTVVGHYNARPVRDSLQLKNLVTDAPLIINSIGDQSTFVVGNGKSDSIRSNAFTVSDNGHSVVYGINGDTAKPYYGATYQDNTVVAWGDIDSSGTPIAKFGVESVQKLPNAVNPGTYIIKLKSQDDRNQTINFANASIAVTVRNNDLTGLSFFDTLFKPRLVVNPMRHVDSAMCGKADATELGLFMPPYQNVFIVHTYRGNGMDCITDNRHFFLKVCARP